MDQLNKTKQTFFHWCKKHGRGPGISIPQELKDEVLGLSNQYSLKELGKELGLHESTISKWRRTKTKLTPTPKKRNKLQFMEIKSSDIDKSFVLGGGISIELIRTDGNRMRVSGCGQKDVQSLISEFVKVMGVK